MHRNRFTLLIAGAMALASCAGGGKYVNALPDDAAAVAAINLDQMARKSGADERTAAALADMLKGEIQGSGELIDKIAADPSESGLDLTDKVYLFASPQAATTGILVRVDDKGKVDRLVTEMQRSQVCAEPIDSDGCTWTTAGTALVAYTGTAFLVMAEPGREPDGLQHRASMLLRQKDGEGFAASDSFGRIDGAPQDVAASVSLNLLPAGYAAPLTMGVSADLKTEDVKCFLTLNFEEGRAVAEAEPLVTDKLMLELIGKQREASGPVEGTYLDFFPANTCLWMSVHADGGKVYDLLCENPTVRRQFESSMMPVDFRLIFSSIKGDVALAVTDPLGGRFIAYADVTDSGFLRTFDDLKPLLSLTGGAMTLVRTGDEFEFRTTDGAMIDLKPGAAAFWFGVRDGRFYVTNDRALVGRRVPGLTLRDCEWGARPEGKTFFLAANLSALSERGGTRGILGPFVRMSDYVTIESDGKKARMEWTLKNRKENVLKQLTTIN